MNSRTLMINQNYKRIITKVKKGKHILDNKIQEQHAMVSTTITCLHIASGNYNPAPIGSPKAWIQQRREGVLC